MITNDGEYSTSIKQAGYFATKYSDAFTEYMDYAASMRMGYDTFTGECDAPMGHVSLHGKRIMFGDSRGFVCHDKYPSADAARQVFDAIDAWYCEWDQDDSDDNMYGEWLSPERQHALTLREQYVRYVIACATENLTAHDYGMWATHNYPKGPLG